jgi:hypothetical protein
MKEGIKDNHLHVVFILEVKLIVSVQLPLNPGLQQRPLRRFGRRLEFIVDIIHPTEATNWHKTLNNRHGIQPIPESVMSFVLRRVRTSIQKVHGLELDLLCGFTEPR